MTMRDLYLERIREKYPNYKPRHDFDLFAAGCGEFKGPECKLQEWIDSELADQAADVGSAQAIIDNAARFLGGCGEVTGVSTSFSCLFVVVSHSSSSASLLSIALTS